MPNLSREEIANLRESSVVEVPVVEEPKVEVPAVEEKKDGE
jgi:hypothetical protein